MAIPDLGRKIEKETLDLSDGTNIALQRTVGVSDNEWQETRKWLEANPEEARRMEMYSKDAGAVRAHLQTQALADYYQTKLGSWDEAVSAKIGALDRNPEFAHIFDEVKRYGSQSAMHHYHNEPLMMKLSRTVGGVPEEARRELDRVQNSPITFQEACKWGKLNVVQDFLAANGGDVDSKDSRGCTGLAYAVGANRTAVIKALLAAKASVTEVDSNGSSALHYAAGYGRKELAEYFLSAGCQVNSKNSSGQTALALATKNKQSAVADFLKGKGGSL